MDTWKKPENPPATLTKTDSEGLPANGVDEAGDSTRTRPPMQNNGTWGDVQYPNTRHTTDPKAPKLIKVL